MKVLIAGGLGYIGSSLAALYYDRTDLDVIVLDNRFVPERIAGFPKHIKYVEGDIRDLDLMRYLLKDVDVMHLLAAEVQAESSKDRVDQVWTANYDAPRALVEACPASTRVMFASTCNVFGGLEEGDNFWDISEEDTPKPKLPYAETKVAMEKYLKESGRDYTVLRFGTNHGYSLGIRFNLVTNIFFKKAMLGENLPLHGGGLNYRPSVSVNDCARALDFLSRRQDASGEIFHVVCEKLRIRDVAEKVVEICNTGAKVEVIDKVVPFNSYAPSNEKILSWGFEFAWDLESSLTDLTNRFRTMQPVSLWRDKGFEKAGS